MASRLATTIYYIEDTDSLRFALSVYDGFDVAALQPHFPGYPVFWAMAKVLYVTTGSFAVAFSLVGGLATFVVAYFAVKLAETTLEETRGRLIALLIVVTPLIWLMGNRYMPDLAGLAVALASLYLLTCPEPRSDLGGPTTWPSRREAGFLLLGLLAGLRLSYVPFLLIPALVGFVAERGRLRRLAAITGGTVVWLVPMILDTGWRALVGAAGRQTEGHFMEFGGTIETDPNLPVRALRTIEALWADGLGGYWWSRHPLTLLVGVGLVVVLVAGARTFVDRLRTDRTLQLHLAAWFLYAVWMVFFQNVVYKSRHVLPLLPLIVIVAGIGLERMIRAPRRAGRVFAAVFLAAYAGLGTLLAIQHREPSAIAQARAHLEAHVEPTDAVLSIPLVNFYLAVQGVEGDFVSIEDTASVRSLERGRGRVFVVGSYPFFDDLNPTVSDTFYHNPYVNRMWPDVQVHVFDALGAEVFDR